LDDACAHEMQMSNAMLNTGVLRGPQSTELELFSRTDTEPGKLAPLEVLAPAAEHVGAAPNGP